jgi:hypothetical protein
LLELALGRVLDRLVEREYDHVPVGRGFLRVSHRSAARVGAHDNFGGAAADKLVEGILDAPHARVVGTGIADHLRRQLTLRVVAPVLGEESDAVELQRAHRQGLSGIDLAPHPHEGAITAQLRGQLAALACAQL